MYVKLESKRKEYSKENDFEDEEDAEDEENVDPKHESELRDLFRISSELGAVLVWRHAPEALRRYVNTGGDEDLYALKSRGVDFPSSLEFASCMKTTWFFYDADHSYIGMGFVAHHA